MNLIDRNNLTISSKRLKAAPQIALVEQLVEQLIELPYGGSNTVLMNAPFNLYLLNEQADLYIKTISNPLFIEQLYDPYVKTLKLKMAEILKGIGSDVDFIDLGPGLPDKSMPLIRYLNEKSASFRYFPVDISKRFLQITQEYITNFDFPIIPLNLLFEELPEVLENDPMFSSKRFRVFNLGFTFCNFPPNVILNLLSRYLQPSSIGLIATELIDDQNVDRVMKPYKTKAADDFNFLMLKYCGLTRDHFDYLVRFEDCKIEMGYIAKEDIVINNIDKLVIPKGVFVITSVSYRYTSDQLGQILDAHFSNIQVVHSQQACICIASLNS